MKGCVRSPTAICLKVSTGEIFTDQFIGKTPELSVGSEIDSITSATKTSVGVVNGVNFAHDFAD